MWVFFDVLEVFGGLPFCNLLFYLLIFNKHSFFIRLPVCIPECGTFYPSSSAAFERIYCKREMSQRTS